MKNKAIIFKADYGFNLAHNQNDDECVLLLQIYDIESDMFATLYFRENKVKEVLKELHNDYRPDSIENLKQQFIEILPGNSKLEVPYGIRADYRKDDHPFVMVDNKTFWE